MTFDEAPIPSTIYPGAAAAIVAIASQQCGPAVHGQIAVPTEGRRRTEARANGVNASEVLASATTVV